MSDAVSHDLARLAAHALDLLSVDQLVRVLDGLNLIDLTAKAMSPMRLSQLMELAARCAYDLLKEKRVRLTIGTDKLEQGQLDYDVVGKNPADLDTLKLIASEMAEKDDLSIDNKDLFHMVSAVITAAQMLANDLDEGLIVYMNTTHHRHYVCMYVCVFVCMFVSMYTSIFLIY